MDVNNKVVLLDLVDYQRDCEIEVVNKVKGEDAGKNDVLMEKNLLWGRQKNKRIKIKVFIGQ